MRAAIQQIVSETGAAGMKDMGKVMGMASSSLAGKADGKKIADFKKHNLHVVNYSHPIQKNINLEDLKKKLHTLPTMPTAIPYITSYYKKDWGFCLNHDDFKKLKKGKYKVLIK